MMTTVDMHTWAHNTTTVGMVAHGPQGMDLGSTAIHYGAWDTQLDAPYPQHVLARISGPQLTP